MFNFFANSIFDSILDCKSWQVTADSFYMPFLLRRMRKPMIVAAAKTTTPDISI